MNSDFWPIEAVALTAAMLIDAYWMERDEFFRMVGKTANKPNPFIKAAQNSNTTATIDTAQSASVHHGHAAWSSP